MSIAERLPVSEYAPRKDLIYVDTLGLHALYQKVAFKGNHILVGPKGIAKSLSVAAYAAALNCPIITFDCSEDVRRSHLIGLFVVKGEETPFLLGPIPSAFEIANETGRCILVLEEINALAPTMQKVLNSATDFRRRIEVPEAKAVFNLKADAKLWIVGTMNPSVYGGVYALNEDLKSRFRMIRVNYPSPVEEMRIIQSLLPGVQNLGAKVLQGVLRLAQETRQGAMEYSLSTRDLVQILEDMMTLDVPQALSIASGKFEGDDYNVFLRRAESIFEDLQLTKKSA
jgi:nitric oxide reductase NorQ protein